MDPKDFHYFFNNPDLDFQEAVQVPVQKLGKLALNMRNEFILKATKGLKVWNYSFLRSIGMPRPLFKCSL